MVGINFVEFFIVILLYITGIFVAVAMMAVAVAWGIRWGGTWLLREISKDIELEEWLKRIFNRSENKL